MAATGATSTTSTATTASTGSRAASARERPASKPPVPAPGSDDDDDDNDDLCARQLRHQLRHLEDLKYKWDNMKEAVASLARQAKERETAAPQCPKLRAELVNIWDQHAKYSGVMKEQERKHGRNPLQAGNILAQANAAFVPSPKKFAGSCKLVPQRWGIRRQSAGARRPARIGFRSRVLRIPR